MNDQIIRRLDLFVGFPENLPHKKLSLCDVQRGIDGQFPLQTGEVVAVGPATVWAPQPIIADWTFCVLYVRVLMGSGQIGFQPDGIALIANDKSMR
ncbi:hypothetical protein N9018_01735 [Rhodopirellula sp.]|nr:hypothetical protein [Rubripirellula sp.]MDB4423051.1 hypothetical protein [Rhodopirellula sp.]MDB4476903.1 hypothetical protein [Rhodopirellula sp.]MDB4624466.1 hypothetical protein [Rubripirellula sp.]